MTSPSPEAIEAAVRLNDQQREPGWYWLRMIQGGPWRPYRWYHSRDGEALWVGTYLDHDPFEIGPRIPEPGRAAPAEPPSDAVERAREIISGWAGLTSTEGEVVFEERNLAEELAAAIAAARREAIEECARLCDVESEAREHRAKYPLPGDETLPPFPQSMVQTSKSVTAYFLARAIRALADKG